MYLNDIQITVLMPAYNVEEYIGEAIDSVLSQTFTNFELLIVNDGSTDRTKDIISAYRDERIVLVEQPNGGVSAALNTGLKSARGRYIARFDADDICYPHRLEMQYHFMEAHPDHVIVGSNADYMDVNGNYLFLYENKGYTDEEIRKLDKKICPFVHSTVFYKKDVVKNAGGYDPNAHTFEDHLLWIKLLRLGKAYNFKEPLIKVRFNPASVTIDEKWRGKRFTDIKYAAIEKEDITQTEGDAIMEVIRGQNFNKYKDAAYYAMVGKKYLWNKHDGKMARRHLKKAVSLRPGKMINYILYMLSFMPERWISYLYHSSKKRKFTS